MKAEDIELTLGETFEIHPTEAQGCLFRKLIWRNNRPIGHWSYGSYSGKGLLWLQNYAGYYSPKFCLTFDDEATALRRAKQILEEWDDNEQRPTWTC